MAACPHFARMAKHWRTSPTPPGNSREALGAIYLIAPSDSPKVFSQKITGQSEKGGHRIAHVFFRKLV
jgi:hypothetical protein